MPEPRKRGVDDLLRERVRERGVHVEDAMEQRTVDEVERDLDVRVCGNLPAVDGALEDHSPGFPSRLDEAGVIDGGEGGVALCFDHEGRDHPAIGVDPNAPEPRADLCEQVAAQ